MKPNFQLKNLLLFKDLNAAALAQLSETGRPRECKQGELILEQGSAATDFFVLVTGAIKLFRSTSEGKEQTLYLVEEGEPFCLCTIFFRQMVPLNAQTIIPSTIITFPGRFIEQLARSEPQLLFNILHVLNGRLMRSMQMIEDLALRDIQQRAASFLLHSLHSSGDDPSQVTLTVPRQEVAKILGTTPETISRVLTRMVQKRVIETKGRHIGILDQKALVAMAG